MKKLTLITAISLLMLGCARSPYLKDKHRDDIKTTDVDSKAEVELVEKIGYLSRSLMEADDRAEIVARIRQKEIEFNSGMNAGTSGGIASATVNLTQGTLNSTNASQVGLAVSAGSFLLGEVFDGSYENFARVWLPAVINGKDISTPEQAAQAYQELHEAKVAELAKKLGWTYKCVIYCDKNNKVYYFKNNGQKLSDKYFYQPNDFYLSTYIEWGFEEVKDDDPVKYLLGSDIKWRSKGQTGLRTSLHAEAVKNEDGSLKIVVAENGITDYYYKKDLKPTLLGQQIMSEQFDSPYMIDGTQETIPPRIYYNNDVYLFYSNSSTNLTRKRLKIGKL